MIHRLLLGACVAAVAVGLGVPAIVSSGSSLAVNEPRPILPFKIAPRSDDGIGEGPAPTEAGYLGVVVALQSVELSARFDGTLERLDVQVGDHVRSGTPIARLDSRSIARDLAIAEATLLVAEAEHDRLVLESQDAAAKGARLHLISELIPREQLATADSQEQIAAARVRGSLADLAGKRARTGQLRESLRDAQIVAPFDGTIAARYVEAGTTVSRSTPIVRVISPSSLVIRFAVPEEQAAGVVAGRTVTVRVESIDLTAEGVIESIAPEIDAALRMVVVEARLPATGGRINTIPSGAIARVVVAPDRSAPTVATASPSLSPRDRITAHE
jgi:RND family efflux transporter MFP subunit